MRAHKKPAFEYQFDIRTEIEKIKSHKQHRNIPAKRDDRLLIATWNLTNFGLQKRESDHLKLMAKIIENFDLIAVQEVADDLTHFDELIGYLGNGWDAIFTDIAGNKERLGYIFNRDTVRHISLVAELAMRGYERRKITIQVEEVSEEQVFEGFNRNPYMAEFQAGNFIFTIVNVHLYWTNFFMRQLEARALSKWAKSRVNKDFPPNKDIILIGDFNMEKLDSDYEIYKELTDNGLNIPKHETECIGTNLAGDKHYDELAFFPSRTEEDFTNKMGVFDFDNAIFKDLWDPQDREKKKRFFQYIRYYIADHRPLWVEFKI